MQEGLGSPSRQGSPDAGGKGARGKASRSGKLIKAGRVPKRVSEAGMGIKKRGAVEKSAHEGDGY